MADTIKIPLIGDVKKSYAIGGGIVLLGIGGIIYYRSKSAAASAAASSDTTASTSTDTSGSYDPNAIDPSTGETYGQEALNSNYGYGGIPASGYGGANYGSGSIIGYDQYGDPIYGTGASSVQTTTGITTNSEWATEAENDLATLNVDTATAATAISKILAGLPVTSAQQDLFMQAQGLVGEPPPQGYPQPIKLTTTPAQPTPPTTGGTTLKVIPNVVGKTSENAVSELKSYGFTVGLNGSGTVVSETPKGGTKAKTGSRVDIHAETVKK